MPDYVVIGGGIAGVAAAARLAPHGQVTILEMESTLAFHTTGRSAAMFTASYGGHASRPLARASRAFLENPPDESADSPLLARRGALWIGNHDQAPLLADRAEEGRRLGANLEMLDARQAAELVPVLNRERLAGGLLDPEAADLDVAALHQAFVRLARRAATTIITSSPVRAIERTVTGWRVRAEATTLECDAVVNAAGAWGDQVAALAGILPVGLTPMRRTAFMVPGDDSYARWPLVDDVEDGFYFKSDGTQILCSLAEENPDMPGDPRPRPEDVAMAIERINLATDLAIRTVSSEWVGLRTFAPDREMVIGEEPDAPGFFWLVGQGGTGIMTSPAYGELVASQVLRIPLPPSLTAAGVDPVTTLPNRFRESPLIESGTE
ncbi:MAG TPA: FAD-dependent oxidoreductase [Acidimicrobiia bacterium]